jgi:hypothetical protein
MISRAMSSETSADHPFGGVEGDDAQRSVVLSGDQIGDRGFEIGALFAGLGIGAAIAAEIIEHEIDGLALGRPAQSKA